VKAYKILFMIHRASMESVPAEHDPHSCQYLSQTYAGTD